MATWAKASIALLAGLVGLLLVIPSGCADTDPPQCTSIFNLYSVPYEPWLAPLVAVAMAGLVFAVLWSRDRSR